MPNVAVVLKCLLWTTAAILCKVCDCVPWVWWWLMDEGCRRPGPWLFRVAQHMTCFLCVGCLCRILWGWSGLLGVKEVRQHLVRSGLPPFSNARFARSFYAFVVMFQWNLEFLVSIFSARPSVWGLFLTESVYYLTSQTPFFTIHNGSIWKIFETCWVTGHNIFWSRSVVINLFYLSKVIKINYSIFPLIIWSHCSLIRLSCLVFSF